MTDIVDQTLKSWRQSTFQYGKRDCIFSVADYLVARGAPDVLASGRGTYGDHDSAMALLERYGGAPALLDAFGLPRCDPADAGRGDVLLVDPQTGETMIAGLCLGEAVALRAERGVMELSRRFVKISHAWKVV